MRKKRNSKELVPLEESRRVIYLEGRGKKKNSNVAAGVIFAAIGLLCLMYCIGIAFYGFGTLFFLVWGGMGMLSLLLASVLCRREWLEAIPAWIKRTAVGIFLAGLLLFAGVEGMIFTQFNAVPEPGAEYCIVLGAQWKSSGPGEMLRKRLDCAVEYLKENENTIAVVSGGQGSREPIPEAEGMKSYLLEAGIPEDRILVENMSTNTYENLQFSGRLLSGENARVVIVTNNFHVFRALKIARHLGYQEVQGLAADSVWGLLPNNLLREFVGVLKDFFAGNL